MSHPRQPATSMHNMPGIDIHSICDHLVYILKKYSVFTYDYIKL